MVAFLSTEAGVHVDDLSCLPGPKRAGRGRTVGS